MSKPLPSLEQSDRVVDAPPPYTAPGAGSSSLPHQTVLPSQIEAGHVDVNEWIPPPNESVASARAQRRFWVAMVWAFGIWILVGLLLGGGISDIEAHPPTRRGHWDKHGDWHND